MKPKYPALAAAALALTLVATPTLAQDAGGQDSYEQLPSSGAHDEGLGKSSVIKLSANLASHSQSRRLNSSDLLYVSALRWDQDSGTVWVYKTAPVRHEPYHSFAIRVYMHQDAPGKVTMKLRTFCDVGSDPFLNISQGACDEIRNKFAPELLEQNRQAFMTFIGGSHTTPAQIKDAGTAIHDSLARMLGENIGSEAGGKTVEATGSID